MSWHRYLSLIFFLFLASCGGDSTVGEEITAEAKTELTIYATKDNNWGDVDPADAEAVAYSAGEEVVKNIPGVSLKPIILKNKLSDSPITLYKRGPNGEYYIGVNINGLLWAQLAYQFSHELGHVLSNYGNTVNNSNQWFEEAVCEAVSLQAIKDMAVSWKTKPPYPNWKSYASSLQAYFQDLISEDSRYLSSRDTMADWYQREKSSLRSDAHQRDKNEIVGTRLFLFLNAKPDRWRSIKYLNIGDVGGKVSLAQFLNEWKKALPNDLKYVATTVSSWF